MFEVLVVNQYFAVDRCHVTSVRADRQAVVEAEPKTLEHRDLGRGIGDPVGVVVGAVVIFQ